MSILKATALQKHYSLGQQQVEVLKNVSFEVFPQEFISILGRSGSGKSTLLNLLGCLDVPCSGSYWLDNQPVVYDTAAALAQIRGQKIGFVFQKFNLINRLTVLENVMLPQLYVKQARNCALERAKELLGLVDLAHRMDFYPHQLSGGQQQRVCIARALANRPSIILADEPTGSLDVENGQKILRLFLTLRESLGVTMILVTHDQILAGMTDRVLTLENGYLVG